MQRFAVLVGLCALICPGASAQQKKRVAVLDFDYATVSSSVAQIFQTNVDVGKGIADLIVDRLVRDGKYSVIERKAISKVLTEQNFSNSDRADANSAAKIGRLLGVDAIIIGSITQFGRDDKTTNVGGGALGGFGSRYGFGGVGKRHAKAVVGINARMVSTDTGEILTVASGQGQSTRSGTTLLGSGGSSGSAGGGAYDMTSKNFGDTILGEAVGQAVTGLSEQLEASASKLPTRVVKIEGLVADATGGTLILNVGSKAGLKVGDKLEVKRAGREIRDPATGRVIRRIESDLGSATVTEVDELSAVAKYSGSEPAKVGDVVRNSQ